MAFDSQAKSKLTILIVDDSRLIRVAAKKILVNDFDIAEAEDGEVAWTMLQENPALQLVMSDLSMPNLDGLGLLARLRASDDQHLKNIPVIIATGAEDDDGSKETALSAGANNFITKPFDSAQLVATAKSLLAQQQAAQTLKEFESVNIALKSQVSIDIVTGTYNRKAFEQRGEEQLAYAVRHHTELALLGIQLDRYKIHFLRRGKVFAETLLKQFSELLSEDRRREDTLAHLGHGEFALLLPSADPVGTRYLADALRRRIEQHTFTIAGESLSVTASIGIACPVLSHSSKFAVLLDDTQHLIKAAEHDGGNCIQAKTDTSNPCIPAHLEPVKLRTHVAQPGEVSQALNALRFNSPIKGDIDSIVRAVMPLLENWNTQHGGIYRQSLESIWNALFNKPAQERPDPEKPDPEIVSSNEKESTHPA